MLRFVAVLLLAATVSARAQDVVSTATAARPADFPGIDATFEQALVGVPAGWGGRRDAFIGRLADLPAATETTPRLPTVLYLHGSPGIDTGDMTLLTWLVRDAHVAFVAPDSFKLPNRIRYSSPVEKSVYEQVHNLRQAEIKVALPRLAALPFVDNSQLLLAGWSEGGLAAARWRGAEFKGRLIYSWPCELNYFTSLPTTGVRADEPVLNVMGGRDQVFAPGNPWNTAYTIKGHCGDALRFNPNASILLVPNGVHDVFQSKQTRWATLAFIADVLGR